MNTFVQQVTNLTETQNGAISYKSSLNKCLDLFSMAVTYNDKKQFLEEALKEDPRLAFKIVLYLRDVRNGQGNRYIMRAFHEIFRSSSDIAEELTEKYLQLFPYLPEVGSWKDIYELYGLNSYIDITILTMVIEQLREDFENKNHNSLCAKWFPLNKKINGKSIHNDYAYVTNLSVGTVRQFIVSLRTTVEQPMCAKEWSTINYPTVPSKANAKYAEAFLRNDKERRSEFLQKATSGEVKMNSSVLYPHEIVHTIDKSSETADALWANLPDYMAGSESFSILPIIDLSSSMRVPIYGSSISCMRTAIGLGLYFAEHNKGDFKDVWCNFSATPNFYKLKGNTLSERVKNLDYNNWGGTTNLQAVFDLILATYNLTQVKEDLPKVVLIVSDMEFNKAEGHKTNFEAIKEKYLNVGLEVPIVVFWRVDTKVYQQPVTMLDNGTILVNGFSPNFIKLMLKMDLETLKSMTPLNIMLETVEPMYPFVDEIFSNPEVNNEGN